MSLPWLAVMTVVCVIVTLWHLARGDRRWM